MMGSVTMILQIHYRQKSKTWRFDKVNIGKDWDFICVLHDSQWLMAIVTALLGGLQGDVFDQIAGNDWEQYPLVTVHERPKVRSCVAAVPGWGGEQ